MVRKILFGTTLITVLTSFRSAEPLKAVGHYRLKVPEPSDIVFDPVTEHFFIASDKGILWECDSNGGKLSQAIFEGIDFEGVEVNDGKVYVVDETTRQVHRFDCKTLHKERSWYVSYSGGRNKSYETIVFNKTTQNFLLITEKQPVLIREVNKDFVVIRQDNFSAARDISAARWHNGFLYLLSDEDRTIYQCHPETYQVLSMWRLPVLNPEGLTFDKNHNLIVVGDDIATMYRFSPLPIIARD